MPTAKERETGTTFLPKFDTNGLLCAVVQDADTDAVLMVAYMDREALQRTVDSGFACFYSRSRKAQWMKGETSGNTLAVEEVMVDCDQDTLVLRVKPAGPACHTGAKTCFYRRLADGKLEPVAT